MPFSHLRYLIPDLDSFPVWVRGGGGGRFSQTSVSLQTADEHSCYIRKISCLFLFIISCSWLFRLAHHLFVVESRSIGVTWQPNVLLPPRLLDRWWFTWKFRLNDPKHVYIWSICRIMCIFARPIVNIHDRGSLRKEGVRETGKKPRKQWKWCDVFSKASTGARGRLKHLRFIAKLRSAWSWKCEEDLLMILICPTEKKKWIYTSVCSAFDHSDHLLPIFSSEWCQQFSTQLSSTTFFTV